MAIIYEKFQHDSEIIPCWRFMDINRENSFLIKVENIEEVIEFIRATYYDAKDAYFPLSTDIVTTEMNPNKDHLASNINLIELPSSTTPEKLESKSHGWLGNKFQLAKQALIIGNIDILNQLQPEIIKDMLAITDIVHPRALIHLIEQGYDPELILEKAAQLGFPGVIDACAAKSIDLDIPFRPWSQPPLFMAALNGNVNVMRAFHNHGIQLDKTSPNGSNLAHFAAINDHDNVIAWLATEQPELLIQQNTEGDTPAEIAVKGGHEVTLREIIKWNVPSSDDWNRLLMYAAKEGHTHLIPLFVSQGVNLSQLNPYGYGAAHVAAHAGNVTFLSALGSCGVDLGAKSDNGETPLMSANQGSFVHRNSPETIAAIKTIIEDQFKQKCKESSISSRQFVQTLEPNNMENEEEKSHIPKKK